MIFEALTAGCKTGLLKLSSTKKDTQVTENLKSLVKDGFVLPIYDFLQGKPMPVANFPSQADICQGHPQEIDLGHQFPNVNG